MINPLQAMAQARSAMQNPAMGIQAVGATSPELSLRAQALNAPTIGQRMDGPAPRMVTIDPNFYPDRKQARDFNAINQERQREFTAEQNRLRTEEARRAADLLQKRTVQNQLDAERRLAVAQEEERRKNAEAMRQNQKMMGELADERYSMVREPAGEAIQRHTNWFIGGGRNTYYKNYFNRMVDQYAMSSIPDDVVQEEYKAEFGQSLQPGQKIKRTDPQYLKYAKRAFEKTGEAYTKAVEDAQEKALKATQTKGKEIADSHNTVVSFMTKYGFSPQAPQNPLTPEMVPTLDITQQLPAPEDKNLPPPKTDADPSSPFYSVNLINTAGDVIESGVDFVKDNAGTLAATGGGLATYNALNTPSLDKVEKAFDANKDGLDWRNSSTMKDARANKIAAFKKIASASGAPVPSDDAIAKMKPDDIKKYVEDKRRGILGRAYGRMKGKKMPSRLSNALLKGGAIAGVVLGIKDLATALTPQEKEELQATDELVEAQNKPSEQGQSGGITWRKK